MIRVKAHPVFMVLLVVSLLGTPVTYRGGAAAAHPHMFLQLWRDAASGSFSHQAHRTEQDPNAPHNHSMNEKQPLPLTVVAGDAPNLTVSPFVVSDWGVPVLHAPSAQSMERDGSNGRSEFDRPVVPASHPTAPEPPPPQDATI